MLRFGSFDDRIVWMVAGFADAFVRHSRRGARRPDEFEIALSPPTRLLLDTILGYRVERAFICDHQMIIGNRVNAGHACAVKFGKLHADTYRFLRQFGTIRRDQDMLEHTTLLGEWLSYRALIANRRAAIKLSWC